MNKYLIVPIILAVLVASVLVVSEIYLGPLLSVRFTITSQPATVYGAYVDLGNLTPGISGSVTTTGAIYVYKPGVYNITVNPALAEAFSYYSVTLSFSNSTASTTLTFSNGYPPYQAIYLNRGNYTVTITLDYQVSESPGITSYSGPVVAVFYSS